MSKDTNDDVPQLIKLRHFTSAELMRSDPDRVETSVISTVPQLEELDPNTVFKLRNVRIF